jgi:hypothetical protein
MDAKILIIGVIVAEMDCKNAAFLICSSSPSRISRRKKNESQVAKTLL